MSDAPVVTMRQLLAAGVHFGHQTKRWNPKMKPFIFDQRSGIYIIDLRKTLEGITVAYEFVRDAVALGGDVLFVGTKKQCQDAIRSEAERAGQPFVNFRWLGGMLTNFPTIHQRILYMKELEMMESSGEMENLPKKEALRLRREHEKLERNLGGIRNLSKPPAAVFIIDTRKEHIAVTEANKLKIPVVAVVDTNCDPDLINYNVPGNDDAIRSAALMARVFADAAIDGKLMKAAGVRPASLREAPEALAKAGGLADADAVAKAVPDAPEVAAPDASAEPPKAKPEVAAPDASAEPPKAKPEEGESTSANAATGKADADTTEAKTGE